MKNASSRLARLEQKVADGDSIIHWDWANDPFYLSLDQQGQTTVETIMAKLRPHLPQDPTSAMDALTLHEIEVLEQFYIARFGSNGGLIIDVS